MHFWNSDYYLTKEHKNELRQFENTNLRKNYVQIVEGEESKDYGDLFPEKSNPGTDEYSMKTPNIKLKNNVSFNFLIVNYNYLH